jgi:hypothetical protein
MKIFIHSRTSACRKQKSLILVFVHKDLEVEWSRHTIPIVIVGTMVRGHLQKNFQPKKEELIRKLNQELTESLRGRAGSDFILGIDSLSSPLLNFTTGRGP